MFNSTPFYHGTIRSTVVAFGRLFSGIKFERKAMGSVTGETIQSIQVPIAYSNKEKWVQSIEQNPDGNAGVYTTLPRMGFEITGYSYDAARKLNRMGQITCETEDGKTATYTPVPYNLDFALYFATKTQEDGLQILEQILPAFTPEYTLSIHVLPALGVPMDIPFVLNSVTVQDDFEGDLETRRFVIHTLTFTAKINLFGGVSDIGVIKKVEANINTKPGESGYWYGPGYSGFSGELGFTATQENPDADIEETWLRNF